MVSRPPSTIAPQLKVPVTGCSMVTICCRFILLYNCGLSVWLLNNWFIITATVAMVIISVLSVCLCVSVCLYCLCSNFWRPWPRNVTFGVWVRLLNTQVVFLYRGHRIKVKVKVTGEKMGYSSITKYVHSRVVRLESHCLTAWLIDSVTAEMWYNEMC